MSLLMGEPQKELEVGGMNSVLKKAETLRRTVSYDGGKEPRGSNWGNGERGLNCSGVTSFLKGKNGGKTLITMGQTGGGPVQGTFYNLKKTGFGSRFNVNELVPL